MKNKSWFSIGGNVTNDVILLLISYWSATIGPAFSAVDLVSAGIRSWTAEMRGLLPGLVLVYSAISLHVSGYVMQEISLCSYGDDTVGNVTFRYSITFNHVPALGYNNSIGNFFTEDAIDAMEKVVENYTAQFNDNTEMLHYVQSEEKRCKDSVKTFWNGTVKRRVKPSMEVFSPEEFNEENLPVLICHVWGFYPQDIIVTLVKNDKMVVKSETHSERVGDWTYQVVVKLDLRDSHPGDNYTCLVEHQSLDGSMMKTWKPGLTSTQIIKISVAAGFFALGLITLIAGVFCWMNAKRRGYTPIPGYNDVN
ncbi:class II histocompatibility antigen, M beta 1 chain-like [Hyla sarda]|uniref:class II histocompatibility antigen, M beta 1 chain-like n=1 Tax=Hyla sarda TaxID=327740 RepID=UPI0024C3F125|nr:class II histocompatibility antigen, M beta 1 chain-like [Hyla sarda]